MHWQASGRLAAGLPFLLRASSSFSEKVVAVRMHTAGFPAPVINSNFTSGLKNFRTCNMEEVLVTFVNSPTTSSSLDPIPTFLLKEFLDALLPFLTVKCNTSLPEVSLPVTQHHSIITPVLKKPSLDTDEMKNYRPITNLSLLSKAAEQLLSKQLTGTGTITS